MEAGAHARQAEGMGIGRIDASSAALAGMQRAQAGLSRDATTIASSGPDVDAMIDLNLQGLAFDASARALRAADRTSGSLIDVLA
jgi:hypothetical protein